MTHPATLDAADSPRISSDATGGSCLSGLPARFLWLRAVSATPSAALTAALGCAPAGLWTAANDCG
jgi:hypothetical protein